MLGEPKDIRLEFLCGRRNIRQLGMNLGIIGSGKVGRALGAWAAKVDFSVAFTSRTQEHAVQAEQNAGLGARALNPLHC